MKTTQAKTRYRNYRVEFCRNGTVRSIRRYAPGLNGQWIDDDGFGAVVLAKGEEHAVIPPWWPM